MAHKRLKGMKRPKLGKVRKELKQPAVKGKKKGGGFKAQGRREEKGSEKRKAKANNKAAAKINDPLHGLKKDKRKEVQRQLLQEKQHLALYPGSEGILLIGEGNFSFARALCTRLERGEGIIATAFDNDATLKRKYPDAASMREEIEKTGGTTLVGVDATRLHKVKEFHGAFTKIVWNFPHLGSGEKDMEKSIAQHQKLLGSFFAAAAKCLDPSKRSSAIHVALRVCEPYKSWKIVQVAQAACPEIQFRTAVPFAFSAWPGYEHRRTVGSSALTDVDEDQREAKVYVFALRPESQ